jgi:hypothetical protein
MTVPTSYTEIGFSAFLEATLGHTATALGWSAAQNSFDEVVNDTLIAMGETDITNVTDIPQVRAIGRLMAWRAVVMALAGDYDFSADGASYSRSQAFEQAKAMLAEAQLAATEYDPQFSAISEDVVYTEDYLANHNDYLSSFIDQWEAQQ